MKIQQETSSVFTRQGIFFGQQKTKPLAFRLSALQKLKSAIKNFENEIYRALYADLQKSEFEAYATEIGFVLEEISFHQRNLKRWVKPERVSSGIASFPSKSRVLPEPLGRTLIIAPWNYPFQLIIAPLIGAISAGNTAILKPSEISVHTSAIVAKIIKATFSEEYIAVFEGDAATTKALLELKFDHIFFTGSPRVGQIVMEAAAKQLIPVTLELGGKSPCIVDVGQDLKLVAKRIVWGKLLNAGQTCIAPDYIMVHDDIKDEFVFALAEAIKSSYGNDAKENKDYPRIVSRANTERLSYLLEGATIYYGGKIDVEVKYVEPTILIDVAPEMPVMQQEIFGPIIPVLNFSDVDQVVQFVNGKPKPLALYCFSDNKSFIQRIINEVPSGGVTINDTLMHISNNRLPFGGVGNSGMGHYHGKYSFDLFSHKKAVLIRGTWLDIPLRYAPFAEKLKYIKKIMG
jgi:aldehyde dehydrogenase (NAD+)